MANWSLLAVATKSGVATTALLLLGLGLLAGFVAMTAAQFRAAADGSEARSRGDVPSRLRALDELVAQGALRPEDYATRQAALLKEI